MASMASGSPSLLPHRGLQQHREDLSPHRVGLRGAQRLQKRGRFGSIVIGERRLALLPSLLRPHDQVAPHRISVRLAAASDVRARQEQAARREQRVGSLPIHQLVLDQSRQRQQCVLGPELELRAVRPDPDGSLHRPAEHVLEAAPDPALVAERVPRWERKDRPRRHPGRLWLLLQCVQEVPGSGVLLVRPVGCRLPPGPGPDHLVHRRVQLAVRVGVELRGKADVGREPEAVRGDASDQDLCPFLGRWGLNGRGD
jgi:hypothetical protein